MITLRDMYKKHHWQLSGPTFYQLHLLFDVHAEQLTKLIDNIAERIQILGGISIAMAADVAEVTKVERPPRGREEPPVQIDRLLEAHELILKECHAAADARRRQRRRRHQRPAHQQGDPQDRDAGVVRVRARRRRADRQGGVTAGHRRMLTPARRSLPGRFVGLPSGAAMPARPKAVAFDSFQTLFSLDPLKPRLEKVGVKAAQLSPWYARALRDACALAAADAYQPWADIAASALTGLAEEMGTRLSPDQVASVMAGLRDLRPVDDVRPAFEKLKAAGVAVALYSQGSPAVMRHLVEQARLGDVVDHVISCDDVKALKPLARGYHHVCDVFGHAAGRRRPGRRPQLGLPRGRPGRPLHRLGAAAGDPVQPRHGPARRAGRPPGAGGEPAAGDVNRPQSPRHRRGSALVRCAIR